MSKRKKVTALDSILGSISKVKIMRTMFEKEGSGDAMTGRGIGDIGDSSPRACQLSLDSLCKQKILSRKPIGRAYVYELNVGHKFYDILKELFYFEKISNMRVGKIGKGGK